VPFYYSALGFKSPYPHYAIKPKRMNNMGIMLSLKWAWIGVVLGLLAFIYNYTMVPLSLPGYELVAAPAMYALSFFSEETPFYPKLLIFLTGQYLGYFTLILLCYISVKFGRLVFNTKNG